MGIPEKIKQIEEEIARTQVNKATERHLGLLKARKAKLMREQEEQALKASGKGNDDGYAVKKTGDATVVLIGLPSVGKSTILNQVTNAKSKVGAYDFTTLTVVPGLMEYRGAKIQVLDLPGIIAGAAQGKGLGKRVLSVARAADLILITLDVFQPGVKPILVKELREIGIRPDERPPNIVIEKTPTGGLSVIAQVPLTRIKKETVKDILAVYGVHNARVMIREDISDEQLIDVILGNRTYAPTFAVLNKIDMIDKESLRKVREGLDYYVLPIAAETGVNIDEFREQLYQKLAFIRIYMRPKGGETDYKAPLIARAGYTIGDVCDMLHKSLRVDFKYAQVWGKSVRFGGQKVGLNHRLQDEDVLTFVSK
ncbi:MAG: GTP-binding protein [Candidatus Bathyarchaeota archaeon]|nr:GTP-binding protein [Candidatus Bathyarchaeota archaeon]